MAQSGMDDLVGTFIAGVVEILPALDNELPRMERNPADPKALAAVQLLVQTIGNTCGFLALPRLNALAAAGEAMLAALLGARLAATPQTALLIGELGEALKSQVYEVSRYGVEQPGTDDALLLRLQRAARGEVAEAAKPAPADFFKTEAAPAKISAAIPALIVEASGAAIAIPYADIMELVRVAPGTAHAVEMLYDAPVMRRADAALPLGSLGQLLGLQAAELDWEAQAAFVVVCRVGGCDFGLIVDRVQDAADIALLPVSRLLAGIPFYSGNAILEDERVVMVLNLQTVAARIGYAAGDAAASSPHPRACRRSFLLITAGGRPRAVPLEWVVRLEAMDVQAIGIAGGAPVVRYRGDPMRLVMAADAMQMPDAGQMDVVVCAHAGKTVGLVAESIDDIAQAAFDIVLPPQHRGAAGSMMIGGRAIDLIDAARLFESADAPAHEEFAL